MQQLNKRSASLEEKEVKSSAQRGAKNKWAFLLSL